MSVACTSPRPAFLAPCSQEEQKQIPNQTYMICRHFETSVLALLYQPASLCVLDYINEAKKITSNPFPETEHLNSLCTWKKKKKHYGKAILNQFMIPFVAAKK